jgi:hypothetical protein
MATTARSIPNLGVTATDIMDTQSDNGFDYGDIELDLDATLPEQHQDDDLSIHDAPLDAGLDTQTDIVDQDDFMDDHEDYGDYSAQYTFEENQNLASFENPTSTQAPAPTPPDDDLIDYSDDEDDVSTQVKTVQAQVPTSNPTSTTNAESRNTHNQPKEDAASEEEQQLEDELDANDGSYHEPDDNIDGDDDGVQFKELETQTNGSDDQHDTHEEQISSEIRPITVYYEGNDLWLFKQHDTDDSGDWLIDDISIIHASLSELFSACRISLGEDISSETELGLRFDSLHNMELWEDNTACVAVSLERLAELYYTLKAQDGDTEPQWFCMCLLSRPRFATLLSDVAKHVEQGSGYSGLGSAIAAGDTHFADAFAVDSTEPEGTEEWGNEDDVAEEEQGDDTEPTTGAEVEADVVQSQDQVAAETGRDEDANFAENTRAAHSNVSGSEDAPNLDQEPQVDDGTTTHDNVEGNEEPVASNSPDRAAQPVLRPLSQPSSSAREEQLANDIVDYSDDEDETEPLAENHGATSTSPSTVHVDNSANDGASHQAVEPTQAEEDDRSGHDDAVEDVQNNDVEDDLQFGDQLDESYQDYTEDYGFNDAFQEFPADAPGADSLEPGSDSLTNQDDIGYEYQDLDQQFHNNPVDGTVVDDTGAGESTYDTTDYTDGDYLLDLDNTADWATDSVAPGVSTLGDGDIVTKDEEEDGVAEQPAVAASSAADPVAASSADPQVNSPQGTKRSIDEVGDLVGDATDSTGKRQKPNPSLHNYQLWFRLEAAQGVNAPVLPLLQPAKLLLLTNSHDPTVQHTSTFRLLID